MSDLQALINAMTYGQQPNEVEGALMRDAGANVFAAPYYQSARIQRERGAITPEQQAGLMQRVDQGQQTDHLATLMPLLQDLTKERAAIPSIAGMAGVELERGMFDEQTALDQLTGRAGAAQSIGSGAQSAASGGYDINDALSALSLPTMGRQDPTSVQTAKINAAASANRSNQNTGPKLSGTRYIDGTQVRVDDASNLDQINELLGTEQQGTPAGTVDSPIEADVLQTHRSAMYGAGAIPTDSNISIVANTANGQPVYAQNVVINGQRARVLTAPNSQGVYVSTIQYTE